MRWLCAVLLACCCSCQESTPPPKNRTPLATQEQREEQAIELVQQHPSAVQGVTVVECLTDVLKRSIKMGKQVKVLGWDAIENSDGSSDVFFRSLESGRPLEFHWKVKDGRVVPADDPTKPIMIKKRMLI